MSTIKNKIFSSRKTALSNARSLAAKGEISKGDLRNVKRHVSKPINPTSGKAATREMRNMEAEAKTRR
jgi:hypothetical protein